MRLYALSLALLAVESFIPGHVPASVQKRKNMIWMSESPEEKNLSNEEEDGDVTNREEIETETELELVEKKSAAKEWARLQEEILASQKSKKKFAVIGGGWGGWGAAKALCESHEDVEVTLLDALPDPTGATPFLSKTGKPGTSILS